MVEAGDYGMVDDIFHRLYGSKDTTIEYNDAIYSNGEYMGNREWLLNCYESYQKARDVHAEARKRDQAKRQAAFRSAETLEQSQARRTKDAERHASVRAAETPDESQRRPDVSTKRQSEQRCASTYKVWTTFNDAAFNYGLLIDYANQRLVMIGKMDKKCVHCIVFKWEEEAAAM
ncbi:hypothetical protein AVEN_39479-1 [Araneus ventricosus]|uniref:Uncharacterized protein n=1 Tax=Araneus ventricosus TaxID=182803 RepID=A0A4Y2D5U3_ARAVE|nr:hypothetical protein AVEN_39479-1 [Araneus ventricosus]